MTRHELMCRMSGWELAAWQALFTIRNEEAQEARDRAESPDGEVIYYGRERDEPPVEDEDEGDALTTDGDDL
jgi:hypothetical protein